MSDLVSQDLNMIFKSPKGETVHALKDISFSLKKGELLTVLGPSGCGKTTLLNIAAGFLRPTSGNITLGNKEINGPGVERGMVFQQGALFEWLTVNENVNFGLRMKKEDPIKTAKKVEEWLDIVGLQGFGETPTYQLSGGMQQRVALARCLINDPELILMDEPLGALDALTREKMQSLVLKIWKETGKTIILITHSVEEALLLGERLYVMAPRPGRIHKEYKLPFASMGLNGDLREVKNDKEIVAETAPEDIDLSSDVKALVSADADLSDEFKQKAATIFETAVRTRIKEQEAKLKIQYDEKLSKESETIKGAMADKVDAYLNYVVEEWMKENELAVERGIRTEIAEDFITGLKTLFKEHYIDVPEEKYNVFDDLTNEKDKLEDKLNEKIKENVELNKQVGEFTREKLIGEVGSDLADTELEKFTQMASNVEYDNAEKFKEKLETVKESYFPKTKQETASTKDEVDSVAANEPSNFGSNSDAMAAYTAAISKNLKSVKL